MWAYFYWKISYFGNFLYTAPCQPGGPRLYQGWGQPPGPTLATALNRTKVALDAAVINASVSWEINLNSERFANQREDLLGSA